jgi:hypothetical protein
MFINLTISDFLQTNNHSFVTAAKKNEVFVSLVFNEIRKKKCYKRLFPNE